MSFFSGYLSSAKYLAGSYLFNFSLEKKLKDYKVLIILEAFNAVVTVVAVVVTVASVYFSQSVIASYSAFVLPFAFFSWFYCKHFHELSILDASRNTLEQSAKNVQVSAQKVQNRREVISDSVKKLEEASSKIVQDSALLSEHEMELRKIAIDVKECNRLKKQFHKEIKEEIDRFSEISQKFKLINQEFSRYLEEETKKDVAESLLFEQRAKALSQKRATLAAIAIKVAKMMELKLQVEEFRLRQESEFVLMVQKIPMLAEL